MQPEAVSCPMCTSCSCSTEPACPLPLTSRRSPHGHKLPVQQILVARSFLRQVHLQRHWVSAFAGGHEGWIVALPWRREV